MNKDEARKHNTVRQLIKCLAHLRNANRQLYFAEDHSELCASYSNSCKDLHNNLDALRAGVEETQKILTKEVSNIRLTMETPSAEPPPIRGAHLQTKLSPRQRDMERRLGTKFPAQLPTRLPVKKSKPAVQEVIPHTKYQPRKNKPRNRYKEGKIVI